MTSRKYRYAFWGELAALASAAILFVLPLRLESHPFGLAADRSVDFYYAFSLVAIVAAQVGYMWPLRSFRIASYIWFLGGMSLLLLSIVFWWSRIDGRSLDFAHLESGEIWGPLIFALALPTIHAFTHLAGTTSPD